MRLELEIREGKLLGTIVYFNEPVSQGYSYWIELDKQSPNLSQQDEIFSFSPRGIVGWDVVNVILPEEYEFISCDQPFTQSKQVDKTVIKMVRENINEKFSFTVKYALPSERTALIYENDSVSVYRLPQKGAIEEISEKVASFVAQEIAQKGFTNILAAVTSTLVSKLGGFFLTFISQSKEVGIQTIVDIAVLAEDELTNTIEVNGDFLPLMIVTAGTSFDYGVVLTLKRSTGLYKWEIERQVQLLDFEELSALFQQEMLQYGDRFLVVPKEPLQPSTTGKYQLLAKAWCDSEGNHSRTLRVVEVSNEQIAAIRFLVTPSVFYIDVKVGATLTVRELNGIGVNLNHIRGVHYDTQGNLVFENEASGEKAHQLFDEEFGTHYLPPHGTLESTAATVIVDTQTPGRMVMTIGGTDDNGNFVTDSSESEIRP